MPPEYEKLHQGVYARAQSDGQEALRTTFLDIAARLLTSEGPDALTMRRISTEAGCSTTVLYRLFGAKEGIASALYREGFARLQLRLAAVPADDDPVAHLAAVGRAYWENALAERNFYGVMFSRAIPDLILDDEARAAAAASLDVLRAAAQSCIDAGAFRSDTDADEVTDVLWASAHGVISLQLVGHFPADVAEARFRSLGRAAVAGFLVK
jgi:AcrR family transcriptional regulator